MRFESRATSPMRPGYPSRTLCIGGLAPSLATILPRMSIAASVARELSLRLEQVEKTLALAKDGATVPFIARYRKEATGNLDEVQIRAVLELAKEKTELEERRAVVLKSIEEQGKLTPELRTRIQQASTRAALEDLYLPFRPKRRTRATMARERGLQGLADLLWRQQTLSGDRLKLAAGFINDEVPDVDAALAGARDICAELVAEDAALRSLARGMAQKGRLTSKVVPAKKAERSRFEQYYDHTEPLVSAPSHRVLAMLRGETEGVLRVKLAFDDEAIVASLVSRVVRERRSIFTRDLIAAVEDGWQRLLSASLENELRAWLKEKADREAIVVFGQNLRHVLLASPAGSKRVLALDPGLRTGIKVAALDATGHVVETATLFSERGADERARAGRQLKELVARTRPELIAVGNGTGSREAESFVRESLGAGTPPIVSVSEQGASIYSASDVAREELPTLDVSLRGAVSIGRRLQDPLAELVKLDPQSIGVGQYQHDVDHGLLEQRLTETVDSCVNAVGVDLNTASPTLLEHVSGLGPKLARNVVAHRAEHGPFASRAALKKVAGVGPRTFEQAAGFLRVKGAQPLDDSAVHPERYALVKQMAADLGVKLEALVGSPELVKRIDRRRYLSDEVGDLTLTDVLDELQKPGRDPRGDFTPPAFRDDVTKLEDVKEGMVLEGVVTNVTAFGAFVDVGVHQDGLVHVSQLAARFVKDPAEVVKVGDRVKVKVLSVELARRRLALSIRAVAEGVAAR